jgi:LmbE family N-acetylglucosaminyl deacetylase
MTMEKLVEIRRDEQLAAAATLGLEKVEFLNYPDSCLTPSLELRKEIVRAIRLHRPDILITMGPSRRLEGGSYIGHPDHHAAGEAALSAVFPTARDRLAYPDLLEEGLEPHRVREVWVMFGGDDANEHVELEEVDIEKSIAALKAHRSQVSEDVEERVREWKARNGEETGFKYSESFRVFHLG